MPVNMSYNWGKNVLQLFGGVHYRIQNVKLLTMLSESTDSLREVSATKSRAYQTPDVGRCWQ